MRRTAKCIPFLPDLASCFRLHMLVFAQALTITDNPNYNPAYKDVLMGAFYALDEPPGNLSTHLYAHRNLILKAMKNKNRQAPSPKRQAAMKAFRQLVKSMEEDR